MILGVFQDFIQLLYPNICYGCGKPMNYSEQGICFQCSLELPFTEDSPYQNSLTNKLTSLQAFDFIYAMCYYNPGSRLFQFMKALKYQGQSTIGSHFGKLLGMRLREFSLTIDSIVPVPLHPKRQIKRGYNQSKLIADAVSKQLKLPVLSDLLIRTRHTESQTKKHKIQRFENVDQLFILNESYSIIGQNILLIDDVVTTGATLLSCGECLFSHGAQSVGVATVAKASQ